MFDQQYRFYGRHAERVDALVENKDKNGIFLFEETGTVYVNAPIVGFLYGRRAEKEAPREPFLYGKSVMGDSVLRSRENLIFNFQMILLLDTEYEPDFKKRIDKAFRHMGENSKEDEELFQQYLLGGVDVLYEKLIEGTNSTEEQICRLYDFIQEFQEKFNDAIKDDVILALCQIGN